MSGAFDFARALAPYADAVPAIGISDLVLDSRAVAPGEAFVALDGSTYRGLDFAAAAVARGAVAVIADADALGRHASAATLPVPVIGVHRLREVLGAIADAFFGEPSRALSVIGVTGTNGKTSTVHLLGQALEALGVSAATIGTLGVGFGGTRVDGERTTPDVLSVHRTLARLHHLGATTVAMEVSSHALDQGRVDGVRFDVAVFTNLTHDHLDYHGSMARYFDAKARLFESFRLTTAVINRDDAYGDALLARPLSARHVVRFSADGRHDVDFAARNVSASASGLGFTIDRPAGAIAVKSPLLGSFNVANLLAVAAVLAALGHASAAIAEALAAVRPVPGRMNRIGGAGARPLVVVDYAHTPDALEQALVSLRAHVRGRLIVVFGCGGERDTGKRPEMGRIAERLADRVIVTDDNPRSESGDVIVRNIVAGIRNPERIIVERDRARAIRRAIALADDTDCVLIAGKGHEAWQECAGVRTPFDDAEVAAAAIKEAA